MTPRDAPELGPVESSDLSPTMRMMTTTKVTPQLRPELITPTAAPVVMKGVRPTLLSKTPTQTSTAARIDRVSVLTPEEKLAVNEVMPRFVTMMLTTIPLLQLTLPEVTPRQQAWGSKMKPPKPPSTKKRRYLLLLLLLLIDLMTATPL